MSSRSRLDDAQAARDGLALYTNVGEMGLLISVVFFFWVPAKSQHSGLPAVDECHSATQIAGASRDVGRDQDGRAVEFFGH